MDESKPLTKSIFIAEANNALNNLLADKIFVPDGFGSTRPVPIFFRDRDSKIIPDTTASGLISIGFNGYNRADACFWDQCGIQEVIETDADGLPLKYRQLQAPDAVALKYTITARSQHWDDMIKMEEQLARIFPTTHRLIEIEGFKTWLVHQAYHAADDVSLGIFIRSINIEIVGYIFFDDCDAEINYAIKTAELDIGTNPDPDSDPLESFELLE